MPAVLLKLLLDEKGDKSNLHVSDKKRKEESAVIICYFLHIFQQIFLAGIIAHFTTRNAKDDIRSPDIRKTVVSSVLENRRKFSFKPIMTN